MATRRMPAKDQKNTLIQKPTARVIQVRIMQPKVFGDSSREIEPLPGVRRRRKDTTMTAVKTVARQALPGLV